MSESYINIVGDNRKAIAEAIADYYDSKVVQFEDGTISVLVNADVEAAFCINEDIMMESINEVNQSRPNLNITPDNLDF